MEAPKSEEKEFQVRNFLFVVVFVFAFVFGLATAHFRVRAEKAELALARNVAITATGPCGDQFVATVNNGGHVENYIGGRRVNAFDVAAHFQEQTSDGDVIVYRKDGHEKTPVMVRHKR